MNWAIQLLDTVSFFLVQPELFVLIVGKDRLEKLASSSSPLAKFAVFFSSITIYEIIKSRAKSSKWKIISRADFYRLKVYGRLIHSLENRLIKKIEETLNEEDLVEINSEMLDKSEEEVTQILSAKYPEIYNDVTSSFESETKNLFRHSKLGIKDNESIYEYVRQSFGGKSDFQAKAAAGENLAKQADWIKTAIQITISLIYSSVILILVIFIIGQNWNANVSTWLLYSSCSCVSIIAIMFAIISKTQIPFRMKMASLLDEDIAEGLNVDTEKLYLEYKLQTRLYLSSFFIAPILFIVGFLQAIKLISLPNIVIGTLNIFFLFSALMLFIFLLITVFTTIVFYLAILAKISDYLRRNSRSTSRATLLIGVLLFLLARYLSL